MQADYSPQFLVALKVLDNTGECTVDLTLDCPLLRFMLFGSRSNQTEEIYHSFVGDVAFGIWVIFSCRTYLREREFYWIYDCVAITEILEYYGSI